MFRHKINVFKRVAERLVAQDNESHSFEKGRCRDRDIFQMKKAANSFM